MIGNVYRHESFSFKDGTQGKKRFIVMAITGDLSRDDPKKIILHVLKTTSVSEVKNVKFRPMQKGCYNDFRNVYKIDAHESKIFELNTWVQFEVYDFPLSKLQIDHKKKLIEGLGKIEDRLLKQILECISHSEDVPTKYLPLFSEVITSLDFK